MERGQPCHTLNAKNFGKWSLRNEIFNGREGESGYLTPSIDECSLALPKLPVFRTKGEKKYDTDLKSTQARYV